MRHFLDLATPGKAALRAILDEAHRRKAARAGWPKGQVDADAPLVSVMSPLSAFLSHASLEAGDNVIRVGAGSAPATNPFILAPNTTGTDIIRSNSRFGAHAFNVGMSYRF